MKMRSFQQSLLEQIFALDDAPSFTCSSRPRPRHRSQLQPEDSSLSRSKIIKASPSSFTNFQQQILKLAESAISKPTQPPPRPPGKKHKLKTQMSQQEPMLQGNYSTIYTRRSSLDQSLYDKAVMEENAKKLWISRKQKQKQEQEVKQCQHRPRINPMSKEIMTKINKEQLLQKMKKKKEESIRRIIEQSQNKQLSQCKFTPNINKSQRKINKSVKVESFTIDDTQVAPLQRRSINVFDHLYRDSKTREVKKGQLEQKYVMQAQKNPLIDDISRQITKNTNFQDRRLIYEKRKMQKQLEKREKQNEQNKSMYRPQINQVSHNRQKQMPIGQHLYLQSKKHSKSQSVQVNPAQHIKANKKSNQVYEQRKIVVFYQLFKLLDSDQDGSISINDMNLDSLPREIIKIIYPLIEQLEVMEVQLQQHEFICSISNLFKTLSIHEKDILLGFIGSTGKQQPVYNYRPQINNKSRIIASCNQRSQMSIYDYCSIKQSEKSKQLETERIEKNRRELEGCTFQPKLVARHRY